MMTISAVAIVIFLIIFAMNKNGKTTAPIAKTAAKNSNATTNTNGVSGGATAPNGDQQQQITDLSTKYDGIGKNFSTANATTMSFMQTLADRLSTLSGQVASNKTSAPSTSPVNTPTSWSGVTSLAIANNPVQRITKTDDPSRDAAAAASPPTARGANRRIAF